MASLALASRLLAFAHIRGKHRVDDSLSLCKPDFDIAEGYDGLAALAKSLNLTRASRLLSARESRWTQIILGSRSDAINVTMRSHGHDVMVNMIQREAAKDVYDLGSRSFEGDLLDIGGHIGTTALLYHKLHPSARVHVFEPAPLNFFFLAHNAIANHANASLVRLYNRGLSADGLPFVIEYSPDDTPSTRRATMGHTWGSLPKQYHTVRTLTMSALAKACGVPLGRVGLIKLDCEGCEFDLLPSEPQYFASHARRIVGEFHGWHVTSTGHEGNVSRPVIAEVKRLLCLRARGAEDRIEWLRGPPGRVTNHGVPGKGCMP